MNLLDPVVARDDVNSFNFTLNDDDIDVISSPLLVREPVTDRLCTFILYKYYNYKIISQQFYKFFQMGQIILIVFF